MFTEKTVLILGAGASAPYGFPSGEGLVKEVVQGLEQGSRLFECIRELYPKELKEELAYRLVGATSVDAFLEKKENEEFLELGKHSIAAALLPREDEKSLFEKYGPMWYRQLFALLVDDCPFENLAENKLSIVTFNYDRSLEHYLIVALCKRYGGKRIEEYRDVLRAIKVIHVYGKLGRLPWEEEDGTADPPYLGKPVPYGEQALRETQVDTVFAQRDLLTVAAGNIQIISEGTDDSDDLKEAVTLLGESSRVFILGFGFHPTNVRRLRLESLTRQIIKCTTAGLAADRRRQLERYPGLNMRLDPIWAHHSLPGCFDGEIDEFIQKAGLT
jgi:hypothetical protein